MKNKVIIYVLGLLLALFFACTKEPPTQSGTVGRTDSQGKYISRQGFYSQPAYYDEAGKLRIPTFFVRNETDTLFLSPDLWGIMETREEEQLGKVTEYGCSGYTIVVNVGEVVSAPGYLYVAIYPSFWPSTCSHKHKADVYVQGGIESTIMGLEGNRVARDWNCQPNSLYYKWSGGITVNSSPQWNSTGWTPYLMITYFDCSDYYSNTGQWCAITNSGDGDDQDIYWIQAKFYVSPN